MTIEEFRAQMTAFRLDIGMKDCDCAVPEPKYQFSKESPAFECFACKGYVRDETPSV